MKNIFLLLYILISINAMAQTPKVAFVGATRSGSPDGFSFVLGENLTGGTVIYFTDEEYRTTCGFFAPLSSNCSATASEPYLVYTVIGGGLDEGDVVSIFEIGTTETFTATTMAGSAGTVTKGGSGNFTSASSDAYHAFTATNPANPYQSVTEIYSTIKFSGSFEGGGGDGSAGDDPSVDFPNAIVYIIGANNGEYTPALRDDDPVNVGDLINGSNWTTSSSAITLSLAPFTMGVALPVELTFFTAKSEPIGVRLKWQTAQEENNDYFEIEQSTDGSTFNTLNKIIGNGTRNGLSDYSFLDEKPTSGYNYYRLKQVDYDGAFEYSKIVVALFNDNAVRMDISPNPFTQQVFITLPTIEEYDITATIVQVKNVYGQVVHQETLTSTRNYPLDLSKLAGGNYFLQVQQTGNSIATKRLVKF
ncbi:MAG: T9SS type A sorting domain-containing protein [Saprospiraceae bacterium]